MVTEIEKKLAEYRAKKAKLSTTTETSISESREEIVEDKKPEKFNPDRKVEPVKTGVQADTVDAIEPTPSTNLTVFDKYSRQLTILVPILKFLLWASLMTLFVEVEFGAVFFICSLFYLVYSNLRTGAKKEGEISAYSVFNPNCEAIDGTLTAEQFERELKLGPKAVR